MRADRLLSILLLLQVHKRMTAAHLAKRLEVSERPIHRDMEALSTAGIPVTAERGTGGGWSLVGEYETKLTGLKAAEVQALFLPQPANVLTDLGLGHNAEAALIKLQAALPAGARSGAEFMRQRIHIDGARWHKAEEDHSFLPLLHDALWSQRKVLLNYQRSDGTGVERLVDPLGLVVKAGTWYVVAAVEGGARTYRVSRIRDVQITGEAASRPEDFDLAAFWELSQAEMVTHIPRFPIVIRAAPAILSQMRSAGRWSRLQEIGPLEPDGFHRVTVLFEREKDAVSYVLSFGPQIQALEPDWLKEQVKTLATQTAALYTTQK